MGPRKGGGGGGGGGQRGSTKKQPQEIDIQAFIAAGEPQAKGKSKSGASTPKQDAKKKGSPSQVLQEEPKKPTVKAIIGGASWTGKLPVNMLSEHCQKQRWEKPEYTMGKSGGGFISSVILRKKNTKTHGIDALPPMHLPPSHKHLAVQPTALEARHFAATYALFRVCSMRNIHMMMPPTYKDLWKGVFMQLKAQDVKDGKGWMYEADPFVALEEWTKAAEEHAKLRAERDRQRMKEKETSVQLGLPSGVYEHGKRDSKSWDHAVKVDMGAKIRRQVEDLIRSTAIWNPYGVKIPADAQASMIKELCGYGFRESHVEEAVSICKDREEALEWLLIHIPEDDLPAWSLPENYSAGVSLASADLVREAKLKRLAAAGYSQDLCAQVLDQHDGSEALAAESLQAMLSQLSIQESDDMESAASVWDEELETLEAIYAERFRKLSATACQVTLE
ncbi:hypothetical protein KEM52_002491, partial [Ascosphaera acerosa]